MYLMQPIILAKTSSLQLNFFELIEFTKIKLFNLEAVIPTALEIFSSVDNLLQHMNK
jgi:hypothetical protein